MDWQMWWPWRWRGAVYIAWSLGGKGSAAWPTHRRAWIGLRKSAMESGGGWSRLTVFTFDFRSGRTIHGNAGRGWCWGGSGRKSTTSSQCSLFCGLLGLGCSNASLDVRQPFCELLCLGDSSGRVGVVLDFTWERVAGFATMLSLQSLVLLRQCCDALFRHRFRNAHCAENLLVGIATALNSIIDFVELFLMHLLHVHAQAARRVESPVAVADNALKVLRFLMFVENLVVTETAIAVVTPWRRQQFLERLIFSLALGTSHDAFHAAHGEMMMRARWSLVMIDGFGVASSWQSMADGGCQCRCRCDGGEC